MVIPAGFEPTACRLGGDRSILLSYGTGFQESLFYKALTALAACRVTHVLYIVFHQLSI